MEEEPAEEAVGMEAVKEEPDSLKNFEIDDEMETLLEDLEDLVFEFNDPNIQGVDFDEDSEEECVVLDDENESGGEEEGGGEREVGENEEEEEGGEEEASENEGGEEEGEEQEDVEGEEEEENVEFGEGQKHVEFGEEEEQEDVEVEEDAEVEGEEGQEDVEFEEKEEQEDEEEEDPEAEGKYGQGDVDVEQEDNRVDEESVKKGDEIVGGKNTVDNEYEDLSDGEIFSDEESKSLKVEKSEKEILVKNQMNGSSKDDQSLQSSKGGSVKKTRVRIVYKSEDVDKEADKKYSVINNSAKAKITCQPSKTCTKDEATSTIDNEILGQILPNEKTDQHSHNSTNSSIENTKPVRKSSTELSRVVDKCDEQEKLVCDKGSNVEARRSSVSTEEIFHSDFGVQTTFELSMLSKKEMEDECDIYCDLDKLPFKEFESGECTSSDDDEAVNALKLDKMFNHKIDNMMNNFSDSERQDSSSKPTSEQINNSKKKDQIIKLLYKKIKSVGEHKIVQEMLAKNLIDEDSKDKLLEIIRYCVEKRREKKRMKKLKKRAHLLRITKNNDYKEALKLKSEVVSTQEKLSKTRTLSPVVVHSKVTKRVIVDCNSANLKSEIVDNDLRRLIQKKQSLDKEVEASSLVDEKECSKDSSSLVVKKVSSKVLSSCRKKGCYKVNCKKHRSKEEKKLRKAERKKRKIEILIKRRELLKRQYFEERRRNEAALLAAASKQENDLEMQKKIELQNRIKEKIALVLDRKYSKQAEVSRSETVTTNELKQDGKRRSREGSYSSDCSRKSSNKASTSHPIKTVVKGPAADSFSEMYEVLNKKPAKEVKSVSSEVKDNKRVQNDDEGELFPTITSIISKEIEMDTNPPSPPPPPIIGAMEGGEKEEEEKKVVRRVEHVSRRDQHLRQMIGKILSDKVANLPSPPQAAVKPRLPVRRRSRSSVRNSEEVNRAIVKSRSRSPVKHWKPAASKPEAIVAPRRRSPSPGDRYNKRTAPRGRATILEPPLKTVRTREPSCALWKRRSRSRSRENRSALYSPTHSPRSTPYSPTRSPSRSPESPPRLSRLSEIRRQKKEDFEEAIRKWRETQEKKPEPPTYTHAQPPAHMMSPYHVNIPDTSMGQYRPPPVMLGGPSPATYQSQDLMQAAPQPPLNSSGQQVATISTADNGTTLGQSSGGITTITENEPQGLGKLTHCHHNATIADAQPTFNRPPEGFPYFNSQTNPGYPPIRPGMDTELKDGNSIMGFPMFPPSVPPPYKVVHHPKFPYPIPVPYIEPPCPAPPSVAPLIPFLGPPPNMSQPPPGHSLLNAQPPLPLTEPPPLINPPLPSSPAPSTVCSSPVRPSSPAISECGSVRSTTSRKKIGQDIKNVIDLIKGKLVKGEQPSQSESPTKTFNINDVRDIILSVRKSLAQKKSQAETQDKSRNELVSRSPAKNKSQTEPLDKSENGNLAQKKSQSVTPEKSENESSPQDKPKPEERKLRIEFKKPVVKSVLSQEVAPEFIKAMQEDEDEEEEEGELADPKPKLDKEAALQKKMKVLEILNGLNSKMSQDHKTPPGRNGDCDKGRLQTEKTCELNEFNVRKRSPKENGDRSLTVEKCHLYKSLPSSSGRKLQYESKTETRKISDESIIVSRRVTDESEAVTGRISDKSKTVSRRVSDESEAVTRRISDKSKTVSRRVSDESMTASGSISDESNTISGRSFDEPKKVERICDESKTVSGRVSDEPKKVETISDEPNKVSERISEESKTVPGRISDEPKKVERISDESKTVSTNMSDEYKTVSGRISDEPKKVETISNESKTVSGNISDKSQSSQSSENSKLSLEDEVQGKTSIPEASPGHPSSKQPSPIAAELETSSLIDTEPDIVLESVPMDISPIKTQELNEIQSATSSKISPDKSSKEERKCIGQIVFSKSYKDSKAKTEDEKEASSKQKRRFSDTPNDSTKRSHQRSENDYKFSDVESVLQKSVPTEIRTDNLENLTVQEKSSTVDKSKLDRYDQNVAVKDQMIDSGKNESPVSKLSREEIQIQLNRALAHAKAACRASTVNALKNSKSDNKQSPQEKPSSTKVSIQEKLTKDSTPVGTVEAKKNVSLDLKKEGNLPSPENTQFSSSKDSTRPDTASNIQEVRNESSTSNNISTTNPNTPHSDPRLKKIDNESTSKNTEIGQNRVLDPRLKRDPRVRHIEVNRDTDMPQTTKLDPRLNRNLHSETNKSLDPSRASVVDPRLNKTQDAEVGKHFEMSQTLKTDPRLNRPHHAEAVENVDLLKNSSPSPKLSRANSFEVNRNSEILQRTQQNIETLETRNSHSEVSFKKTASKPNLKSLTLRVMNELDPVLLNFGGAEGNIDEDEELETYEIVNDSTRSSNEEYIKNTSITVSKSLFPGPSCVNKFSETAEQNLKLKSSNDGQKAVDPEIKSSITDYSEKSTIIPVKSDQDHAKQQSQLQLETSQNEAEINKTEEKMNDVVESNIEPEEIEASRTVIPAIKKRIAHDQTKVIERKLVKDYVSKSAAQEIRDKDKKPVKYCSSSSKTTSNKEKGLESSTKKEQSLRKGEKSDSKTDKRSSSTSGSVLSEKSKSINVSKSESKHIPSNSKKTDGSTQKSAHINKGDPKFENRTASKSSTASKVDDLRKDKKSEKSTISSEELSKLMKNRRSSYESSTSNAQKNLSSDSSSKLRRVSLDLVMEKEKKKVVIESADIGTSKQSSSAKKSSSSLEKPLLKSSKSTEVVKSAGEVQSDEGRKKAEKYHDKASSSKFVVSNLANKEVTRMEPPKVHQRRSSVIELSSSDDECVRIISPGSKKRSEASSDSVKKTKYKRTDSVLQTCKIIKENLAQKKTSSSNSKGIGISRNKLISEVDILKRQLESDSSDDEIEFMRKKSKPVDSMLTSNAAKKDRGEKVLQSIPTKKVVVCESIREVADGKDKSNDVPVRNIDDNNKSIKKVEVKKVDAISESLNTKQAEKTVMFQKKTETAHEVDKSPVNVTNKIFSDVESQEKAKAIGAIEKPKSDVNTIESIGTSEENNPTKQIDEVGKSDESCACKKIVTEKTMKTVEKIDDTKSTEKVKKLRLSKEGEPVKNAEEVKSSEASVENIDKLGSESSLIGPNNKIGEKENLIDHKSLESSVIETCQASSKMKELTLSNEDFNFEVDASSDVKNAPNTGKTKKIDKTGKLKNKFLKIGDELFPDEESNESSGSFKNLITNICGTLEENSGSPAVLESAVKNIEDASLVVAESIKMLDTFVQVAQSVFRQRKRICVDYFEVTDDNQLIQHISDNKKSKFPKSKLGKGSRSNIIDKDSFDSNSLLSNDSYDVFEFSEDLPAAINDRRSLTSSSETIRSNKPRLETDNNKIEEKDSEPSTADNFIEPSSTVLQSPTETTVVESVRVNEISTSDVKDVSEKDESRIESSGENVIQEKVYEKLLKDIDQIEVIKKSKIISSKNEMNKFSVQTAEKSGNSTDVTNINENHDIPIQIGISSEKTVGTKSFDATLSQNDKKVESSGEEVAGKKGFNKFSAQEIEIIERPAGVVISVKREDEIQAQNMNETSSFIDKKISTSCGTFQVNSESAFQSQRKPVIQSKTSKKLQARYKANLNAFKISTTDEKRKSSLVDDANKLSTSNDSTGNEEPSNEISLINSQDTEVNPNHTLVSNNMIEKSSINKASSKSKTSKRASSVLEEVSDEVPKKKCKLKSKVKAETCDEVEENTDDTNIRVTRARKSGGNLVDSKLVDDESSSVFNDDSQEGEEFSTRVTRKRKIASSSCTVEEVNDLEGDDDKTEGRVTRASKSVGSSARSDEIVLQENDSQETDESKTRVLRARKSLVVMADDSQDSEEFNTRVTRAKKSLVTSVKEVEDDVEEDVPRKKLRSSLKIPSKEGDILNTSQSDDERFWIKICSAFSKNSRTVGAQVAEVRGKLVGFESFESVEQPSEELDLDNAIASLIRLKQQRDSQKL